MIPYACGKSEGTEIVPVVHASGIVHQSVLKEVF